MTAPWQLSAVGLGRAYTAGDLSPVEAARSCLGRIDALSRLNAVVARDDAAALAAARASEARWRAGVPLGPLDGVPLTVKDNLYAAGLPATWGSPLYRDHRPATDEQPVARLRAAGAVVLGKTNVPEFTLAGFTDNPVYGPTRLPWDPALSPGGSSGGAAAAVAAGLGPVALGTDGGGSIRRPAAHAGLVGIKPSPGLVPRRGGFPAIMGDFEVAGPLARTVADAVLVLSALAGPAFRVPAAPRLRILYVPRFGAHPVDPGIAASVAAAARHLAALGHTVEEGEAPFSVDAVAAAHAVVGQAGLAWLLAQGGGGEPGTPAMQGMAAAGRALGAAQLYGALDEVARLRAGFAAVWAGHDAILTPSIAAPSWPLPLTHPETIDGQPAGPRGHAVFTAFANVAGLPGIGVPCAPDPSGLPVGFQLVGPPMSDGALCAVAAEYAAQHPWALMAAPLDGIAASEG